MGPSRGVDFRNEFKTGEFKLKEVPKKEEAKSDGFIKGVAAKLLRKQPDGPADEKLVQLKFNLNGVHGRMRELDNFLKSKEKEIEGTYPEFKKFDRKLFKLRAKEAKLQNAKDDGRPLTQRENDQLLKIKRKSEI